MEAEGIEFTSNNGGVHLIIRRNWATIHFWPGTGKYIVYDDFNIPKIEGRGVRNLVAFIREREGK